MINLTCNDDLQKVLDTVPPHSTIHLSSGKYVGKFKLSTPFVTIIGEDDTVISFNDYAKRAVDGVEIGTFQTYTFLITSNNVTLKNLTIENTAGNPADLGQEVALSCYGNNFLAQNCTFKSTQDTLFLGPLPDDLVVRYDGFLPNYLRYYEGQTFQKFDSCKIYGTVDFIFGCANALFYNCDIISINDNREVGYIGAPAHHLASDIGFVFFKCNLISQNAPTVYLARPWRDFGKTSFIECNYDSHIAKVGYINWNDTYREKTARFFEYHKDNFSRPSWITTLSKAEAYDFLDYCLPKFDF